MDKSLFAALLGAKNLTINELRATAPALADEVIALVRRAEAARLTDALGDAPEDVRARIVEIDITRATGDVVEHLRAKVSPLRLAGHRARKTVIQPGERRMDSGRASRRCRGRRRSWTEIDIGCGKSTQRRRGRTRVHATRGLAVSTCHHASPSSQGDSWREVQDRDSPWHLVGM